MDVNRARYFLIYVRAGSVSAAAEELDISQPALSRQLRRFEEEVGLALIDRSGSHLRLTRAGWAMVDTCKRLVAEQDRAEQSLDILRRGSIDRLVVAAAQASISAVLAPFVAKEGDSIPALCTRPVSHYESLKALDNGADMVVAPIPAKGHLAHMPLGVVPIRAWGTVNTREPIEIDDLLKNRLIIGSGSSVSRVLFDAFVGAAGCQVGDYLECDDVSMILSLASAGKGVGISTVMRSQTLTARDIVHEGEKLGGVPLTLVWSPGHVGESTIRNVGLRLREFLKDELSR